MAGHRNFKELVSQISPEREKRNKAAIAKMLEEMPLQELRQARRLSQETLAEILGLNQPDISKLEQRTDTYVSTLRRYIEAMGGHLEILARFPDGTVKITQFAALENDRRAGERRGQKGEKAKLDKAVLAAR